MKTRKFALIACLLCAVLLALFFVLHDKGRAPSAGEGSCGKNLSWKLEQGTLTISGTGSMDNYSEVHRTKYGGQPDSASIGTNSPWDLEDIKHVVVQDGVTSIGYCAFSGHPELLSVRLPDTVTQIGTLAFHNCAALKDLNLPDSVERIGKDAFQNCLDLKSVTVGRGSYAEQYCKYSGLNYTYPES